MTCSWMKLCHMPPASAGDIVALGKVLVQNREEFVRIILPRIQEALPDAIHRVQRCYGLAIFATLKVIC